MRRLLISSLALVLLLSNSIGPAVGAIKSGDKCQTVDLIQVVDSYEYTCIKSGNKLVWKKGLRVSKTSPSSIPKAIKSFADAVERPFDVTYWAWKKSDSQIQAQKLTGPTLNLIIGPNTKLSNSKPQLAIDAVTNLYPNQKKPNKVHAIYYSHKDIAWAQGKFSKLFSGATGSEAKNSCQSIDYCWGAQGTVTDNGDGILLVAVMTRNPTRNHTSGTLEAHEYSHVLQISNFYGTLNQGQAMCCIKAFAPWWFVEGGAEFSQIAAVHGRSFAKYQDDRQHWADEFLKNKQKKFNETWILNFLKPKSSSVWMNQDDQWRLYDLGMLVSEIYTAIKGPEINMDIFKDISEGMTYEESFKKHFGISWDAAVPLIAKSLSKLVNK